MKKIFPIEITTIENPVKRFFKVILLLFIIVGILFLFIYIFTIPVQFISYENQINQKKEEIEKLQLSLVETPKNLQATISDNQNTISDLRKEVEELKRPKEEKEFEYTVSSDKTLPEEVVLPMGLTGPPPGYDKFNTTIKSCFSSLKDSKLEEIKDDSGNYKIIYFQDGKFHDLPADKFTSNERKLPFGVMSKELNLKCDSEQSSIQEFVSIRYIFKNNKLIAKFYYVGTNTNEYLISKNSNYLFGIGQKGDYADWSVINLRSGTFKQLEKKTCLGEFYNFSADGEQFILSDFSYSNQPRNFTLTTCAYKVDGSFVSGIMSEVEGKEIK